MAAPATPSNFYVQTGNGTNLASCDLTTTATSYSIQRSIDGFTYSTVGTSVLPQYQDTTVTLGVQYWYKMAAVNVDGTSAYTTPQSVVPAPTAESSLLDLRLRAQERADRVNSNFVTTPEWNFFINQSMYELYDLLIEAYEDYFEAPEITFPTNGTSYLYPLPDGVLTFTNSVDNSTIAASAFYKLSGVDLALNNANNAYVTANRYNLIDRNRFVYPNSSSSIYGVFNLQYRLMGTNIRFIPTPSAGQVIRLLYIPRLPYLLKDTDLTTIGFSGWLQYVIIRAAKYALDKEESDTTKLDQELSALNDRIAAIAQSRDVGQPDTISDVRSGSNGMGGPWNGFKGGW